MSYERGKSVGAEGNFTTIQRCMRTCEGLGSTSRTADSATIEGYRSTVGYQTQTELFSQY